MTSYNSTYTFPPLANAAAVAAAAAAAANTVASVASVSGGTSSVTTGANQTSTGCTTGDYDFFSKKIGIFWVFFGFPGQDSKKSEKLANLICRTPDTL